MKTPLQNLFKTQLKSLTGFDFQEMVAKIFLLTYGETDFTVFRHQKDRGNDGTIESEKRVIACYGPKETLETRKRIKDFEDKAKLDFNSFQIHWQTTYPNWSVVINHQTDPQYDNIVKGLTPNGTVIGLDQLLSMIDNLPNHQKRLLGKDFRIEQEWFSQDYLQDFLEDLLKESDMSEEIKYDKNTYVPPIQKIELNYDTTDIQGAINEYEFFAEEGLLKLVNNLMVSYDDSELSRMKNRILQDYNNQTNGNFKTRLEQLTRLYLAKYSSVDDDDYLMHIRVVLITLFEQCLIGNKTR